MSGRVAAEGAPFPGGTGLSRLRVYPWESDDGLHGGSPHVHLVCTECYVVTAGRGRLHTLTRAGFAETSLAPGDVVWFTPGTIHRAVDDGGLVVSVVMQNSGLPEAGDAVMTLPGEHLLSREAYAAATSLIGPDEEPSPDRARARRDLAVSGFHELLRGSADGDSSALEEFYAAAAALVEPRLDSFAQRWREGALAEAQRTGEHLAALRAGDRSYLRGATVQRLSPPSTETLGMCGYLVPYDAERA